MPCWSFNGEATTSDRLIASIVTRTAVPADKRQRLFICGVALAANWQLARVEREAR